MCKFNANKLEIQNGMVSRLLFHHDTDHDDFKLLVDSFQDSSIYEYFYLIACSNGYRPTEARVPGADELPVQYKQ